MTLHAVKIFPDGGHDQIKEGLKWAADQGYDVVNMSHGGGDSGPKKDGVKYAADKGLLLVAAAGNDGPCSDCVEYPAAYDEVIAVSSTNDTDGLRFDSSSGPEVDIAAPGNDIPSTWNDGEYNDLGGTSMASPHVAGAGALLIADGKDASKARTELENSAKDIGLSDNEQGNGLLDVADALGHNSVNDLLEVQTDSSNPEVTRAYLYGQLTELTGSNSAEVFFEWGPAGGGFPNRTTGANQSSTGNFSEAITGLNEDTEYKFRAAATNAEGSTERGEVQTFFTEDNPDPIADITYSPQTPNVGDVVTFDASGTDPGGHPDSIVSYEWDLNNDGSFDDATGVTTSKTFSAGGSTTVKVRVTDKFGQTDTAMETFTVNEYPTASLTHSPSEPNEGTTVSFDASGASDPDGSIVSYEWDFDNDGAFDDETGRNPSHVYPNGGDKTVGLKVTDDNGATDSITQTFHVNQFPTASFSHSPTEPNEGEPTTYDASGSSDSDGSISTYEWDFDDDGTFEESLSSPTKTHSFANGGDKTVNLRVTDDDGATSDAVSQTFHVNHIPTASFTISPDPVVRNESATFDASGSSDPDGTVGLYEWDWDYNGSTFDVDESVNKETTSHTFTSGGKHTVALRVTDDNGATSDPVVMTFMVHIRVAIDIEPNGSGPNPINPNGKGNISVGVLHTSAFDPPSELDPSSMHFGYPDDVGFDASNNPYGGATPAHMGGHVEDVDGDGDVDSVFHFATQDADFDSSDTEGELVGLTSSGVPVFGTDSVKTVGKR